MPGALLLSSVWVSTWYVPHGLFGSDLPASGMVTNFSLPHFSQQHAKTASNNLSISQISFRQLDLERRYEGEAFHSEGFCNMIWNEDMRGGF